MKLVIAEKPSVAMALASVLGARTRKDGYVEGNGYIVSWCVGHLVGLCDASEYDEKYKKWRYEDLPIVPECWKHKILEGTKKQFGILKKLMRDSEVNEVICATDAGREGELIFRWRVLLSEKVVVSLLSAFFNLGQGSLNWDFPEVYPHFLSLLFYPSIS